MASIPPLDMLELTRPTTPSALLKRLGELHMKPHMRSSRTRRAAVALIIRLQHPMDSPYVNVCPAPPKVKKVRVKKPAKKPAHPTPTSGSAGSSTPSPNPPSAAAAGNSSPNSPATGASPTHSPQSTPAPPPASAELDTLLRVSPSVKSEESREIQSRLEALGQQEWVKESQFEILFMQRAKNPQDRWSGQMSFPGGRQDKGEVDEQTVVREVKEEIGWDLKDQTHFIKLGILDDKPMDGLKNVKPLAVSIFVYLQLSRISPRLILEPSEVSSVLFVPLSYFQSLRSSHDFGRIYHPLMLQTLAPRQQPLTPQQAQQQAAAAAQAQAIDLKLIGWPHKRNGKLMTRAGLEQITHEQQMALDHLEEPHHSTTSDAHISELDLESAMNRNSALASIRSRLQSLAADVPSIPRAAQFFPRIEQLASLRFPALSLPGVWMDAEGRGGTSSGDDINTKVVNLMQQQNVNQVNTESVAPAELAVLMSQCPPPFILWGMTLEKSCELLYFLGWPFPAFFLASGSERRRRKYQFWTGVGEARWGWERRVDEVKQRFQADVLNPAETRSQVAEAVKAAPLFVSAFSPAATVTTATTSPISIVTSGAGTSSSNLSPSPYSTPVLITHLKQRASEAWQKRKQQIALWSKL